jgi:predicted dehydrogenase
MGKYGRRQFIRRSLFSAGAALVAPRAKSRVIGANNDIRIAIVGLRKKGREHIKSFDNMRGVRIVALCDCDTQFFDAAFKLLKNGKESVRKYVDYRRLVEDKDVDAVVVSVPDHWHALMTIWACQAGKDVYIEKPASH